MFFHLTPQSSCTLVPLTWAPVPLLHPNVAVALGHTGLRVKKRHPDASLSTESSVVVVTLLHGVSVVLLSQPEHTRNTSVTKKNTVLYSTDNVENHSGMWDSNSKTKRGIIAPRI